MCEWVEEKIKHWIGCKDLSEAEVRDFQKLFDISRPKHGDCGFARECVYPGDLKRHLAEDIKSTPPGYYVRSITARGVQLKCGSQAAPAACLCC